MPAPALHFMYSRQASSEHFQQCAEFLPLRNRITVRRLLGNSEGFLCEGKYL